MRQPTTRLPRALVLALVWTTLWGAVHAGHAGNVREQTTIRALIGKTWDRPDANVIVGPVVVDDHYAIASWTQGERGGRALLRKQDAGWTVVLCGGDALRVTSMLVEAGVPQESAARLATDLASAEAQLNPERVKLFSTFEGVMQMDGEHGTQHHAPANPYHHH